MTKFVCRGFPHDIMLEDKQWQTCALDHDNNGFQSLMHRVFFFFFFFFFYYLFLSVLQ